MKTTLMVALNTAGFLISAAALFATVVILHRLIGNWWVLGPILVVLTVGVGYGYYRRHRLNGGDGAIFSSQDRPFTQAPAQIRSHRRPDV